MKHTLLFLILLYTGTAYAGESLMGRTSGELIVSRNITATQDVALIMSKRRLRFNTSTPPQGIPTQAVGIFDIFIDTPTSNTEKKVLGFGEFREVTDPTNVLYNSVESSDSVGAHFFFTASSNLLALQVTNNVSWASPTTNLLIFGTNGSMIAASPTFETPTSDYKLWIKGNNTLSVSGGIDGPEGGRVRMDSYTATDDAYLTFALNTNTAGTIQALVITMTTSNNQSKSITYTILDSTGTTPYSAVGNSQSPKTFIIDHPIDPSRYLVHAGIEGPANRVFYRGKTTLKHGQAFVTLPDYFEELTLERGRAVFLQNMSGFDKVAVKTQDGQRIKDGVLHIISQDKHSQSTVSWEVSAIRKDVPELIVAPRVDEVEVLGVGPYRYVVPKE
jgi:hypothetical protein